MALASRAFIVSANAAERKSRCAGRKRRRLPSDFVCTFSARSRVIRRCVPVAAASRTAAHYCDCFRSAIHPAFPRISAMCEPRIRMNVHPSCLHRTRAPRPCVHVPTSLPSHQSSAGNLDPRHMDSTEQVPITSAPKKQNLIPAELLRPTATRLHANFSQKASSRLQTNSPQWPRPQQ